MFVNLFKALKRRGVPVTFNEWLVLQKALSENLADSSLTRFYYLSRAILIKTEAHFDRYDQAFLDCFGHIESGEDLHPHDRGELLKVPPLELSEEEKHWWSKLDSGRGPKKVPEEQLRNQDDELHVGGIRL